MLESTKENLVSTQLKANFARLNGKAKDKDVIDSTPFKSIKLKAFSDLVVSFNA